MDETDAIRARVAASLSAWMAHARLSPTDLNKRTSISRDTIYAIKDGKRLPEIENLALLAKELGTSAGAILDGVMPSANLPLGAVPSASELRLAVARAGEVKGLSDDLDGLILALQDVLNDLGVQRNLRELIRAKRLIAG
jgi:transcriptional regulator with XRE-family HTH domain